MLGGGIDQIINAPLKRVDRRWRITKPTVHAPNTGSRKSWAAGDATSRGVRLALMALTGEMGYPSALTADTWGFSGTCFFNGKIDRNSSAVLGSYVMENILFKLSFPAEFHAQTAVEAAITLYPQVKDRLDEIEKIVIETQEAAVRIIDKSGPLANPADRDHCIQYMVAVPLIFGRLTAADYEDGIAEDSRVDRLREKMIVSENRQFSVDYLDPGKRAIGNAIQIFFSDGASTERIAVDFPIGHRRRRKEGMPVLLDKFQRNLSTQFDTAQTQRINDACGDRSQLEAMPVHKFVDLWMKSE